MADFDAVLANPEITADRIAAAQLEAAARGPVDIFVANGPGIRG